MKCNLIFKFWIKDPRLEGQYELVPTRDIHLNQIGFEEPWLHFLYLYVKPLQERVYMGFNSDVIISSYFIIIKRS